jgi:hypothetical protein
VLPGLVPHTHGTIAIYMLVVAVQVTAVAAGQRRSSSLQYGGDCLSRFVYYGVEVQAAACRDRFD